MVYEFQAIPKQRQAATRVVLRLEQQPGHTGLRLIISIPPWLFTNDF